MHELNSCSGSCVSRKAVETSASRLLAREWSEREERRRRVRAGLALAAREAASQCGQRASFNTFGAVADCGFRNLIAPCTKRNTTVQVRTIGEGFGIGSEFSQTRCAANNFRDHDLKSLLNSLPSSDPTHAVGIGPDILLI